MSPGEAPHLYHSSSLWFEWLRNGILNIDIDANGEKPILHYLIDLNVFKVNSTGLLKIVMVTDNQSSDTVKISLIESLKNMSQDKNGFALLYILATFSKSKLPSLLLGDVSTEIKRKNIFNKGYLPGDNKSSNLSNLQIVKKWGNQLRPFLDLEQKTIARLQGKHTSQKDSQWLFSYILNKTKKKSPAKKWEQLSRKRHR
jgi:hypothetical protein